MYIGWREEVLEIFWLGSTVAMLSVASVGVGVSFAWLSQVY